MTAEIRVRRVLVTGAAGRIGRAVLALLAARGIEANALVLDDPGTSTVSATLAVSAVSVRGWW